MQTSFHRVRARIGQGANGVAGRRLLRAIRLAREQDRGRLLLEEGKLEFLKSNSVSCFLQPVGHILRRAIIADGARGTVAAARGRNVLQCLQMSECPLTNREVARATGRRTTDDSISPRNATDAGQAQSYSHADLQPGPNRIR